MAQGKKFRRKKLTATMIARIQKYKKQKKKKKKKNQRIKISYTNHAKKI